VFYNQSEWWRRANGYCLKRGGEICHVAPHVKRCRAAYRKARARAAIDFPLAGVAVALLLAQGRVQALRVALTGTNARPFLLDGTEEFSGQAVDEAALARLSKLIQRQVSPMRTALVASNYRRQVATVLAQRLVRELAS
jgi:4-hydroxybenzoyl-CoA reductase subunit beta